jgi:hypothetical protein
LIEDCGRIAFYLEKDLIATPENGVWGNGGRELKTSIREAGWIKRA